MIVSPVSYHYHKQTTKIDTVIPHVRVKKHRQQIILIVAAYNAVFCDLRRFNGFKDKYVT